MTEIIEKSLLIILLDLFVAGGETASSNLTWGFLFLAMYPEAQAKVHAEIDRVVGKTRLPSVTDRIKLDMSLPRISLKLPQMPNSMVIKILP
jgi:cytochrome P450